MENRVSTPEAGFTIIEVMVAIFLLLLGVLGVATMADNANLVSTTTKARVGATNLAREVLEDAKTFAYGDLIGSLPASGSSTALQDDVIGDGLDDADPSTTGWQIRRRNTTYTVSVFTCIYDDPHDGVRAVANPDVDPSSGAPFCLGSPAGGTGASTDTNPDDARKVEVSVSWTLNGKTPSCSGASQVNTSPPTGGLGRACVTQSELIANPSGGLGPAIRTMVQVPPNYTLERDDTTVTIHLTTSTAASSVTWTADDGSTGTASTTDNLNWTITWGPLGASSPPDGSHLVTAQAFTLTAGGVPKSLAINLNRFVPAVPQGVTGGIDTRRANGPGGGNPAAALSWLPNSDTDILGYTVYRATNVAGPILTGVSPAPDPAVCSTASVSSTSCFDTVSDLNAVAATAPNAICPGLALPTDRCIDYYVVPFDSMWTHTSGINNVYTSLDCSGSPWPTVTVPAPPVPASRSIAPITSGSLWGTARAGCPSAFIALDYTTGILNTAPATPTQASPQCSTTFDGQPIINWIAPPSPDGDGDTLQSYRIYRDPPTTNPAYDDPATTINYSPGDATGLVSFTDPNPTGGTSHNYYVTAVDARFQEGQPLAIPWSSGGCP